jgi:hypothetical protein
MTMAHCVRVNATNGPACDAMILDTDMSTVMFKVMRKGAAHPNHIYLMWVRH